LSHTAGIERWRDRVALVTGASSGIGRAIVHRLAAAGMYVAAVARRSERLRDFTAECGNDRVLPVIADLRDESQIAAAFAAMRDEWGGVDVLVNNAGLGHDAPLMSGETSAWREMLDVNVLAAAICTREAVKDMQARGDDGHVIHISSMCGHRVPASPGIGMYAATKHALRAMAEGLRVELRDAKSKIRITQISPGLVETEFAGKFHQSTEKARKIYSRYDVLQPEDIAEAAITALAAPQHVQVHDILLRPTEQLS